jgi:hypothetical protein
VINSVFILPFPGLRGQRWISRSVFICWSSWQWATILRASSVFQPLTINLLIRIEIISAFRQSKSLRCMPGNWEGPNIHLFLFHNIMGRFLGWHTLIVSKPGIWVNSSNSFYLTEMWMGTIFRNNMHYTKQVIYRFFKTMWWRILHKLSPMYQITVFEEQS